jgi:anti-anti-sigma factor
MERATRLRAAPLQSQNSEILPNGLQPISSLHSGKASVCPQLNSSASSTKKPSEHKTASTLARLVSGKRRSSACSSEHLCRANWRSIKIEGFNRVIKHDDSRGERRVHSCAGRPHVFGEGSNALRAKVKSLIAEGKQKIVLNMEHVDIDSAGLGMLVAAHLSAKTHSALLCLRHLSAKFEEVLRITKLAAVFQICSTEATAIASNQQQTHSILSK